MQGKTCVIFTTKIAFRPFGFYNGRILTYFVSRPTKKIKITYIGKIPWEDLMASIATSSFDSIFKKLQW